MAKTILIKPLITEKTEELSEKRGKYSFVVNKDANKIEIRKAIEQQYGVTVASINTLIMPAKQKNRSTKTAVLKGRINAFKKAVITLDEGEVIDYFGDV